MTFTPTTMAENQTNAHVIYNLDMANIATALNGFTITTNAGTTKTLALADAGTLLKFTSGSASTCTVPPSSSVAFTAGNQVHLTRFGSGSLTVVAGDTTVTIRSVSGYLALASQYSVATLLYIGSNEWLLFGDLA